MSFIITALKQFATTTPLHTTSFVPALFFSYSLQKLLYSKKTNSFTLIITTNFRFLHFQFEFNFLMEGYFDYQIMKDKTFINCSFKY